MNKLFLFLSSIFFLVGCQEKTCNYHGAGGYASTNQCGVLIISLYWDDDGSGLRSDELLEELKKFNAKPLNENLGKPFYTVKFPSNKYEKMEVWRIYFESLEYVESVRYMPMVRLN